ncbi:anchor protein [Opitutaceae bacterium TAV5]|nr:anchor protein [Opitutaceae bacterium TAV5]
MKSYLRTSLLRRTVASLLIATASLAPLTIAHAQSQTLALFDFAGSSTSSSATPVDNLDVSSLAPGDFTGADDGRYGSNTNGYFSRAANSTGVGFLATSKDDALTLGDYVEFSLTPTNSDVLSLDKLTLKLGNQRGSVSTETAVAAFTVHFFVRASFDDFQSYQELIADTTSSRSAKAAGASGSGTSVSLSTVTIDFASLADFQNIDTSVAFRIYAFIETTERHSSQMAYFVGKGTELTGTVTAVPEPATWVILAGIAGLAVACLRRR